MSPITDTVPALRAETSLIADPGSLLPLLDQAAPLVWMRNGQGIAGFGEALRLEFQGENRMRDASVAWRAIAGAADVVDPLVVSGSGLVAFGTFAFAAQSESTSVLIVPEVVIGRREGVSWLTRIRRVDRDDRTEFTPTPTTFGAEYRTSLQPGALGPDAYRAAVADAVSRIGRGEVDKVVLARDLVGRLPAEADLRRILADLSLAYPDCWTYAVDGLLGASPETLITVRNGAISARVLAGTVSRGTDAESDQDAARALLSSTKDLEEHRFAVGSVIDALEPHCAALTTSDAPYTLKLPNLWHLASDINGVVADGSTSLSLINALHPTAAVAGTPKDTAVALIAELEGFDRGRYAGPVGWVGADGDGEWAIALRCAQVTDRRAVTAYAGCGIVAGSDPEREYLETKMKFRPIVDALA